MVSIDGPYLPHADKARSMSDGADLPLPPTTDRPWEVAPPPPSLPGAEPRTTTRPAWRGAVLLLLAGLVIGGGATYGLTRTVAPGGPVTINVDNTPVHATTGNSEGVAQLLVPAVGTIIARLPTSTASLGSGFVIAHGSNVSY